MRSLFLTSLYFLLFPLLFTPILIPIRVFPDLFWCNPTTLFWICHGFVCQFFNYQFFSFFAFFLNLSFRILSLIFFNAFFSGENKIWKNWLYCRSITIASRSHPVHTCVVTNFWVLTRINLDDSIKYRYCLINGEIL